MKKKSIGRDNTLFLNINSFRKMKLIVLFVTVSLLQLSAIGSYAQNTKISLKLNNATLKETIQSIEKQTEFVFFYSNEEIDMNKKININKQNADIKEVLNEVLNNYSYRIENRKILLTPKTSQQSSKITGVVKDAKGETVIGANVSVKGTTNGTVTDIDGNFTLNASPGDIIVISYIGYQGQEISLKGKTSLNIILKEDSKALDEVVVVGYGVQKKVNLTGAVASFKTDNIGDVQTSSASQMLRGRLSGVQVTQNSGKPGSGSTIRIRGVGTLGKDEKNNPLLIVDGQAVDYGIETIDPNDIESISVLKDASSAAIYGSRAANGVILLTTKRGVSGKGKLSVNAYASVQSILKDYDMLNAEQFVMLQNEARSNANMESLFKHEPSYYGEGTDWVKEVTQLAPVQEYNVSFSKGTDGNNYYMSGTYFSQDGIVKNTGYDKISFRFNGDAKVLSNFKVGNSITLSFDESKGSSFPLGKAIETAPTIPVYMEDGAWGSGTELGEGNSPNAVYMTELFKNHADNKWRALGNVFAEWQIIDELRFKVTAGIDFAAQNSKKYYPKVEVYGDYNDFTDQKLTDNMSLGYTWQNDYLLYFNKDIDKHHIDAMAGLSLQASQRKNNDSTTKGFLNDSEYMQVLGAGQRDWRAVGGINRWSLLSYLANVNYVFNSKYLFSFNMRVDGSSRFGKENKYGYFPSGSVAWRINSEDFMKDLTWLSNMKLRASYGSLGNQEIGLYSFAEQLNVNQWYLFGDGTTRVPGVSSVALVDPNIKWETTTITNIGLDLGFLDNTISLVSEFYIKDTKDILLSYPIPSTVGKTSPTVNAGSVRNTGFEMELKYNNQFGKLLLDASVIYGFNKNEVRELIGEQDFLTHNYSYGLTARSEIGNPINSVYGYVMEGIYQDDADIKNSPTWSKAEPGVIKFKDLNNDGKITPDDRTYIGKAMPHSTLGVNLNLHYKQFDFSMFWQGDFGKDLFWGYFGGMMSLNGMRNANSIWLDRWTGAGSSNAMPKLKYNLDYNDISSFHMKKADYFRLKNISVGYTFKFKNDISARLYLAGQNLVTITSFPGFDPEINGIANFNAWGDSYPQARSYTLGVNLNF